MSRSDIDTILLRPVLLAQEINLFVPKDVRAIQFRADLAGLLVVAMAASYETCVKETLINYASKHHERFGFFTQNQFAKLNSRISIADLTKYAENFDDSIYLRFRDLIKTRKERLKMKIGRDFTQAYSQILSWRHAFAHSGIRNTTIEEALSAHILAKRVLYIFDDAFDH